MDVLAEALPFLAGIVTGIVVIRLQRQRDRYRMTAMALLFVLDKADRRGIFLAPFDRAILKQAKEVVK